MAFVLHHELVGAGSSRHTAFVLHGALGSGQNFRGFIKKFNQLRPDYTFVLCDLRAHGDSNPAPAPHTLASCSEDLSRLAEHLQSTQPELGPLRVVIGHSLGGKVGLHFACHSGRDLSQVWALDSNPGTQMVEATHEIRAVIRAVRAVRTPILARADVVRQIREQGLSNGLAQWMTTNLRRRGQHYEWAFDLDAIEQLLLDYFVQDLWPFVEAPKTAPEIHLVIAERSDRWSQEMRERSRGLPASSNTHVHELPDAGHWVHVDNPAGLLELMAPRLSRLA
jgi:pimeloyl-ACP methyl ester carboxylesterase